MQFIISGRHVELAEGLREHLEERFDRLGRFDENVSRIEVTLSEEKKRCLIEAKVTTRRGPGIHAGVQEADFRTAIDRLYEKLSRQLKTRREKLRDRKVPPQFPPVATETEEL
ncbi:MAG: ribosome-associated translation inhibitor RaiA [Gemmatimonadetes bacterium]|nr:ribosome-associated translation inhibitor RaiA [Gemmatimonadota bacterium]NNK49229.1 ribosome-associated translation inhibitor RaiA [Gemmatimonadota bacterium]